MITLHHQPIAKSGKAVMMNCPACGQNDVESVPSESVDYVKIAYVIPLLKLRVTRIRCGHCKEEISCVSAMNEVEGKDAAFIAPLLRYHAPPAARTWALIALLTSWVPVVGLILVSVAIFHSRGTRGWPSSVNVLSVIIAVTATVLGLLMFFLP